jgi:N-glycosylase/DNA lyase
VKDIALRDYPSYKDKIASPAKSLTPSVYEAIGDVFRDKFGSHAGWAHSVLFAAGKYIYIYTIVMRCTIIYLSIYE